MWNMPLEVNNLTMYYQVEGRGWVRAVDGVSFDLQDGESLGIVGESGCGKSSLATTLIRILPSNAKIFGGSVLLDGVDILSMPEEKLRKEVRWKKVSIIFQGSMNALNPVIKVGDQIAEAILLHEYADRNAVRKRVESLLRRVNLDPSIANRYPFELSGGQRQRALIAMALALNPRLVIADEPTTALDVIVQAQILKLLREVQQGTNSMMIFISHDISAVAQVSDKVAVMYAGKIVEIGPAESVLLNPKHPYTKALLDSVPSIRGDKRMVKPIPGAPPNLLEPPPGCRFHPRCPFATEKCRREEPAMVEVEPGHKVACHLYG